MSSIFSFKKRDKSQAREIKEPPREIASPTCSVHDGHIVRLLELEERIAANTYSLKNVEEVVQLYAVVYCLNLENSGIL